MLNYEALNGWLHAKNTGLHHRQFLIIELPFEETQPILKSICAHFSQVAAIAIEFSRFAGTINIPLHRYQDYLGAQTDALIFDATAGIQLNALYAGAGMVRANGVVVVLLNPSHLIAADDAPFKFSYGQQEIASYFIESFKKRVQTFNGCLISQALTALPSSKITTPQANSNNFLFTEGNLFSEKRDKLKTYNETKGNFGLSVDQATIAQDITSNIYADNNCSDTVSIILGARGRGKSTVLGVIGAKLKHGNNASQKPLQVVTCALHKNQLHAVNLAYSHEVQAFVSNQPSGSLHQSNREDCKLPFYPPDEIISLAPKNAMVLIDEISSIAPQLLKNIIAHFSHIVITGTTSGYEGSGNGFLKRVLPYIQSVRKTITYELNYPFRWLQGDHIENCLIDILSPETELMLASESVSPPSDLSLVNCRMLQKSELINDNKLYSQLFSLLTKAHYQTTPNDIVRTLDASECKIFIAQDCQTANEKLSPIVIAVAVVFEEGGKLLESMAGDISLGKRRVQGHLTAQALSLQLFSPKACLNTYLRINRIAVAHQYRRKGIAARLLKHCEIYAHQHNIDYMSVSFGYTQELYKFWLSSHYLIAKVGHRIDTASGTASLLMIKFISKTGNLCVKKLNNRISLDLDYYSYINKRLSGIYNNLIAQGLQKTKSDSVNDLFLKELLDLYLNKQINFIKVAPYLLRLINASSSSICTAKLTTLHEIFKRLHQKGVHKEEKILLEKSLLAELRNVIERDHE